MACPGGGYLATWCGLSSIVGMLQFLFSFVYYEKEFACIVADFEENITGIQLQIFLNCIFAITKLRIGHPDERTKNGSGPPTG